MSDVTIYHNPRCGTSRNVLEFIRQSGVEPRIVLYLETPPSRTELLDLIAACAVPVREVMRAKEDIFKQLDLGNPKWRDDELVDFMLAHPILINRPIVVAPRGTRLCRPSETVLELLRRD